MKRINKNLALFSGLFLVLNIILLFIIHKLSPLIGHAVYYCQSFINTHIISIPYSLSLIPFGLLSLILTTFVIKFFFLTFKIQYVKHTLGDKTIMQRKIQKLIQNIGLKEKTVIMQSKKRFAFCFGVRSAKIYISTGLISQLSEKEIEAVLRHEQYHLENHDTFIMMIASVSYSLFPFFPLLGDLINTYRVDREIQADTFAVRKVGDSYPLVSALKKLLTFPTFDTVAVAAIADQDTLEARIYSLVNKNYTRRQFRLRHVIITLFSSFVVAAVIVMPVYAKEIHHEEHDVMMVCTDGACMNLCTNEKNLNNLYSEIPSGQKTSTPNSSRPYTPMQ